MIPGARLVLLGVRARARAPSASVCRATTSSPTSPRGTCCAPRCKEGTEFGLQAKEIMDRGELVSDDIIGGVVDERLDQRRHPQPRVHPRRVPSHGGPGRAARRDHERRPLDLVIDLVVPIPWCSSGWPPSGVHRLRGELLRRQPAQYSWVCDNCGGEVVQRADDTPEAIQKRLDLYERGPRR